MNKQTLEESVQTGKYYTNHIFEDRFICQTQKFYLHAYFIKGDIGRYDYITHDIVRLQDLLP